MKKNIIILISILFFPIIVNATNSNSQVWSGSDRSTCSSLQDSTINTDGALYFSHCMEAICSNNSFTLYYYNNNKVKCTNGNTNPYVEVTNNSACRNLKSTRCNNGQKKYCNMIVYYDCNRTANGYDFTTTTTTTSTTTKRYYNTTSPATTAPTTSVTTTKKVSSKLSSITLSTGKINFKKDVYEYTVSVNSDISSINVKAIPEVKTSKVKIVGNDKIENDSVITITVTSSSNDKSVYKIKVKKENKKLSTNAKLKTLKIRNHDISFDTNITEYYVVIEGNETELDIYECEPEDKNASILVNNNSNLTDGSKIEIVVTAEDGKTVNTYTINVKVKVKSNFIKILFIIIIIAALLVGAYYIYKKFVAKNSGDKYEYE